jgi:hypothetical protein
MSEGIAATSPESEKRRIDFATLNATLLSRARDLLPTWMPGGKWEGPEWIAINQTRSDNGPGSFKANSQTGKWADFATENKGRDLISLYGYVKGLKNGEAARALAEELGMTGKIENDHEPLIALDVFAKRKGFDVAWLHQQGVLADPKGGIVFQYCQADGRLAPRHHRRLHFTTDPRFIWTGKKEDGPLIPYGRNSLTHRGVLDITEGDSDRLTMLLHGYVDCLGVPGADMWKLVEREDIAGYTHIRLHKDGDVAKKPDEKSGGETFVASGVRRLGYLNFEGELTVIEYPPETKDPNALHVKWLDDSGAFEEEWQALVETSRAVELPIVSSLPSTTEPPRPLKREVARAEPYPYQALGAVLAPVAEAIQDATQAPLGICAQSVLATVCLCVQAHANVELPTGEVKPISEFFLTVAESGERKTAADERALRGVRDREQALAEEFREKWKHYEDDQEAFDKQRAQVLADRKLSTREAKREALNKVGDKPTPPPRPILIGSEPTYEGLLRLLREGHGYCGIFSSEGGLFIGGHGMSNEAKLRTIAGFSELWDGTSQKRIRAGDGIDVLHGRRVALHLLVQPWVADRLFGDSLLIEQGMLSRVLAIAPDAVAGTRPFRRPKVEEISRISGFSTRVNSILCTSPPCDGADPRELRPRTVNLSPDATRVWIEFHDYVEKMLAPDAPFAPIKPLANKAPEHAARLATIIEVFGNLTADNLSAESMMGGIELIQHYMAEALRIYAAIQDSPDLKLAEKALDWIGRQPEGVFSVPDLYQYGPHAIRDAAKAKSVVAILVEHRWINQIEGGAIVGGVKRREAFTLTPEARQR